MIIQKVNNIADLNIPNTLKHFKRDLTAYEIADYMGKPVSGIAQEFVKLLDSNHIRKTGNVNSQFFYERPEKRTYPVYNLVPPKPVIPKRKRGGQKKQQKQEEEEPDFPF